MMPMARIYRHRTGPVAVTSGRIARLSETVKPDASAPAHIVDGPNGGVRVDPALIPSKEEPKGGRPAGLPDKFKSWEEMAKSYTELEGKLSSKEAVVTTPADASKVIEAAGLDLPSLYTEFAQNEGQLTAESLAKLEKAGVSKEAVALHIKGLEALATKQNADLATAVGGTDTLAKILAWATSALSAPEKDAYNAAIDSGNIASATMLLKGMQTAHDLANGTDPKFVANGEAVNARTGVQGYMSVNEMTKDMRDPRYKSGDPAFHAQVAAKIAASTVI